MKKISFIVFILCVSRSIYAHGPGHSPQNLPLEKANPEEQEEQIDKLENYLEDQGIYTETSQPGIQLNGYVDVSYTYHFNGGATSAEGKANPITGEDSQDFNLNQINLTLSRPLPEENRWAAGFALSLNWGEDVEAHHGGDDHHSTDALQSIHEATVQLRIPVGRGLDVSFGKWHSLLSYEAHDRPYNINYTRGLLSRYLDPGQHVGMLMSYPATDRLTLDLGLANGWHNSDSAFMDGSDFSKLITGAITLKNLEKNAWLRFAFAYSPEGEDTFSNVATADHSDHIHTENNTTHFQENGALVALSFQGQWLPKIAKDRWLLGFNATLVNADDNLQHKELFKDHDTQVIRYGNVGLDKNSATAWGIAFYSKYQFNTWFSLAGRLEYLHADDGTLGFVDGIVAEGSNASIDKNQVYVSQTDLYSYTLTAGFDFWRNVGCRLEYRLDTVSSDGGEGDNSFGNHRNYQNTLALNLFYLF